jgi:hypothetical protein
MMSLRYDIKFSVRIKTIRKISENSNEVKIRQKILFLIVSGL